MIIKRWGWGESGVWDDVRVYVSNLPAQMRDLVLKGAPALLNPSHLELVAPGTLMSLSVQALTLPASEEAL